MTRQRLSARVGLGVAAVVAGAMMGQPAAAVVPQPSTIHAGDDLLDTDGNDTLSTPDGDDTLSSPDGDDTLSGTDGNDTLSSPDGDDTLSSPDGDDTLGGDDDALVG